MRETVHFVRRTACLLSVWLLAGGAFAAQPLFLSEEKEVALGQEEHNKIVSAFGLYRDKDLQQYVARVGQRIADQSSRPDLEYTFTILDDEMVNAMALPGGFIYVTRGLLIHLNSEAELAAVLGHEIAHVTERHAIRSQRSQKLLEVLSQVAVFATGTPAAATAAYDLGGLAGGLLLRGYSHEHELEADKFGAEFMAKAGYSPEAMLKTIEIRKAKDRIG
ncbi:MAG: M48 family metalloprotease, partial [Pseudomonadales bacterium]|nr:M48 family metalloprotease [Pseudomonadales bacterium]